mgnify:CR=1 FL=1
MDPDSRRCGSLEMTYRRSRSPVAKKGPRKTVMASSKKIYSHEIEIGKLYVWGYPDMTEVFDIGVPPPLSSKLHANYLDFDDLPLYWGYAGRDKYLKKGSIFMPLTRAIEPRFRNSNYNIRHHVFEILLTDTICWLDMWRKDTMGDGGGWVTAFTKPRSYAKRKPECP